MAGEKKVGKFLTTAKVPRVQRMRILIFADQEKIIWVCPARISEQAKVTPTTGVFAEVTPPRAPRHQDRRNPTSPSPRPPRP
jgi:hypothetical protein